ncbi:MAG: helix-turn-helix domain-containing protein [Thermoleophilia bacterium]
MGTTSNPAGEGSAPTRTLDVLEFLARRASPAPAAIIAMSCSIPRSSLYALLRQLKDRRYVVYHAKERTWSLGAAAHELSDAAPLFAHGLAVLRAFTAAPGGLTVRDIAMRGDLPRSVVERILPYLEESDLLRAEPDGTYSLGLELVSLASRVATVDFLRIVARPLLTQLRDATHETASLIVLSGDHGLYIDQVESPYVLRISGWVGRRVSLRDTATGAAFADRGASHLVEDAVETGVSSVACALEIPDQDAAISILAPTWRLREFGTERAKRMVETVARQIALRACRS